MLPSFRSCFSVVAVWAALLVCGRSDEEAEVDYYVKMIEREMAKAQVYQTPQNAYEHRPTTAKARLYKNYDYIVVGAGSAGAVVASRLSENPKNRVLLLEAGGAESNFTDIPGMSFYLIGSKYNWGFQTVPQTSACQGMIGRRCGYPRGKGLGGSSIINSLNYVRGNRLDYDAWARMGNPGWSYEEVLPYFKKSEDARFSVNKRYHGIEGRLHVEYERPNGRQYEAFVEANLEKGRKEIDYNGPEQLGFAQTQFNTINGQRDSTGRAFLRSIPDRPNLEILTGAYVTKINIFKLTKKANGVTFSYGNVLYTAGARKEVVVSAGTFQSAQLLMLSGIGKREDLGPHGIDTLQELAVGHNLIDHASYLGLVFETNATTPPEDLRKYVREYVNGRGTLTFAINSKALSWFQTSLEPEDNYPDLEVIMVTSNNTGSMFQRFNNYNDETYNALFAQVDPTRSFTTSLLLMRPKSRGRVRLASSDPYDYPLIDSNFFSDPDDEDRRKLFEGINIILDLVNGTSAFKKINARLVRATHPACASLPYLSRNYWYCQLRQLALPFYHPVGTCRMGPDPLAGAVVNHRLQVYGIQNLRVADCSVMPMVNTGHTNAPAIMIGEKAADLILSGN